MPTEIFYKDLETLIFEIECMLETLKLMRKKAYYRAYYCANKDTIGKKVKEKVLKKVERDVKIDFD
tara:strand:- start:261 stop:458 length:198 start_codon:yes stop_codon:yes gene_type:complete